jgi:hypothetical protein
MVLPQLEQQNIHAQARLTHLDPTPPSTGPTIPLLGEAVSSDGKPIVSWILPMLFCPSDVMRSSQKTFNEQTHYMRSGMQVALTNYKGSIGTLFNPTSPGHDNWCRNNGVLPPTDPLLAKRSYDNAVPDGRGNTFLVGEQVWDLDRATCDGRQLPGLGMGFAWAHSVEASAFGAFPLNWTPPKGQPDADGNMPELPDDCTLPSFNGFRSYHPGGALFAFCDGRIVFVSNNVAQKIYQAQFTTKGGAVEGTLKLDQ